MADGGVFFSNLVFFAFMKQWESCLHKYQTQALLRIIVQLEASGYICAESSCISEVFTNLVPFPSYRSSEFEVTHPFVIGGVGLLPAALAGVKLSAVHTFRGLGELQKSRGPYKTAQQLHFSIICSKTEGDTWLEGSAHSLTHFSSYGCKGSG